MFCCSLRQQLSGISCLLPWLWEQGCILNLGASQQYAEVLQNGAITHTLTVHCVSSPQLI